MGNKLRDLFLSSGMKMDDAVALIRQAYPNISIDKPLLSKCRYPERYGVSLSYEVIETIFRQAAPEVWEKYKRETDGHQYRKRIYIRMSDDVFDELKAAIDKDGYDSFQSWGLTQILLYLAERGEDRDPSP